ncbi:DUF4879 domain-containing protein [Luteibacter yeojuensis]
MVLSEGAYPTRGDIASLSRRIAEFSPRSGQIECRRSKRLRFWKKCMKRIFCLALFGVMAMPCAAGVQVIQVQSASGGRELIAGNGSTSRHHGGNPVLVTTREAGRGQAYATMNGAQLREVSSRLVCRNGGGWTTCRNGQSAQGEERVWDATGKGNGTFAIRVTEWAWPKGTSTASFSIH